MSQCQEFIPFLDAYADGEIEQDRRRNMEVHLHGCAQCQQALQSIFWIKSLIRNKVSPPAVPLHLRTSIKRILAEPLPQEQASAARPETQAKSVDRRRVGLALAAMLLLTVGASLVFPSLLPGGWTFAGRISMDHVLCWNKGGVDYAAATPEQLGKMLTGQLGFQVNLQGVDWSKRKLLGAKICRFQQRRAAHLFITEGNHKYSYYVYAMQGAVQPQGMETISAAGRHLHWNRGLGYSMVWWEDNGCCHLIVSGAEEKAVRGVIL